MLRSNGTLKTPAGTGLKDVTVQEFTPASWNGWLSTGWGSVGHSLRAAAAYDALYDRHVWVAAAVNKLAGALARLPLKTYLHDDLDRPEAPSSNPYARIIAKPSQTIPPFLFWLWSAATTWIYGECMLRKERDRGGRPIALHPIHPTRMVVDRDGWQYVQRDGSRSAIARRDFVHLRLYNPRGELTAGGRGASPLEPLRATLEHEYGALTAQSSLWRNGARPSIVLKHPTRLSKPAYNRLRASWADQNAGVENWAHPAILEEGMEADALTLSAEELQYIEGRKLNREEVCGAYDVPPPVLHILDRATFSNITEQMRSMYRDTMAPRLSWLESILELELRDGRLGALDREPDFGEGTYAEFVLDGVLRGDFEQRVASYASAVQNGWMMPAEVRKLENLPAVEGSDVLLINGTLRPIELAGEALGAGAPSGEEPVVEGVRSILGRLARLEATAAASSLQVDELAGDTNGRARGILELELRDATMHAETVADLRQRLKGWTHA